MRTNMIPRIGILFILFCGPAYPSETSSTLNDSPSSPSASNIITSTSIKTHGTTETAQHQTIDALSSPIVNPAVTSNKTQTQDSSLKDAPKPPKNYNYRTRYKEGYRAAKSGKLNHAIEILSEVAKYEPDYASARIELARALLKAGRLEEALKHVRRGVELAPKRGSSHRTLGRIYQATGKLTEAREAYTRATECQPPSPWNYNNLGYCCLLLGDSNAAVTALRQAVELAPENAMMWNTLGVALERSGNAQEALKAFRRALEIDPKYPLALKNLERIGPRSDGTQSK